MKFTISGRTLFLVTGALLLFFLFATKKGDFKSNLRKKEISPSAASITNDQFREIRITAKKFSFSPNIIKLKFNENVQFILTSEDVAHGFSIPELNINQPIQPGKESRVDFQASKKGSYTFLCSIPCGAGHSAMRGTIVVK